MATIDFAALADPTRVRIVEVLAEQAELPAGRIADRFPSMTRAGVSRHLRILEDAGFVSVREEAQRRLYRLERRRFDEIDSWLDRYRDFWTSKVGALHRHVERDR